MRIQAVFDGITIETDYNVLIADGFLFIVVDFLLKLAENDSIVVAIRLDYGRDSSIVQDNQLIVHDFALNVDDNEQIIDNNEPIVVEYKRCEGNYELIFWHINPTVSNNEPIVDDECFTFQNILSISNLIKFTHHDRQQKPITLTNLCHEKKSL